MLSIPDMALLGAAALIFFGPEQLPKVARKVGILMRDVQNTSQTFIREMERAADDHDAGGDVSRAHLLDEPSPAYGAYDGGYVANTTVHDVPAGGAEYPLEVPAPETHPVAAETHHDAAASDVHHAPADTGTHVPATPAGTHEDSP